MELGELLRDTAQDARAAQPGRQIEVRVPPEGTTVVGDEALLVQLVGVLVANALAHTPVTAPVTLSANREEVAVVITVDDRGPGLDPDSAAHVFDRFWRRESSRNRNVSAAHSGGAGLGLSIARSITDAHGGTIALETALGKGCTFIIRLPLERGRRCEGNGDSGQPPQ